MYKIICTNFNVKTITIKYRFIIIKYIPTPGKYINCV